MITRDDILKKYTVKEIKKDIPKLSAVYPIQLTDTINETNQTTTPQTFKGGEIFKGITDFTDNVLTTIGEKLNPKIIKAESLIPPERKIDLTKPRIKKAYDESQKTLEDLRNIQIQPIRASDLPIIPRGAVDIGTGVLGVVEGLSGALEWVGIAKTQPLTEKIQKWQEQMSPEDPSFLDELASGVGSASTFFIPGLGVARTAGLISRVSPKLATLVGGALSTFLESSVEAGLVYNENKRQGKDEQANNAAFKTFLANIVLVGVTNKFGIFGNNKGLLKRVLLSAPIEGFQELWQEVIANVNTGRPWFENALKSGLLGSIIGGGFASITPGGVTGTLPTLENLNEELERLRKEGKIGIGLTIEPVGKEEKTTSKELETPTQEATIIQQAKNDFERAQSEVFTLLELSEAGERLFVPSGKGEGGGSKVIAQSSTFPDFISSELRSKELFNRVINKIEKGIELKGGKEIQLKEEIEQAIFDRMDTTLADEKAVSDFIQELEIKKDKEVNKFVKEIEKGIIEKLTSKRFSLLQVERAKIKAEKRGIKMGAKEAEKKTAKSTRNELINKFTIKISELQRKQELGKLKENILKRDIENIRQETVDYAKTFLSKEVRGELISKISKAKNIKNLEEIKFRIQEIGEKSDARKLRIQIKKELSKIKPKKQAGKPIGKFTPFIQKVLDGIKEAVKLTEEQADVVIEKNLDNLIITPEIALQNKILTMYSGLQEKTSAELQKILNSVIQIKEEGRVLNELNKFNIEEDLTRKRNLIVEQATGGIGLPKGLQTTGKPTKTFTEKGKAMLKSLGAKWIMSWDGLMKIVDFNAGIDNQKLSNTFSVLDQENEYKKLQSEYVKNFNEAVSSAYNIENKPSVIRKKIIDTNKSVKLGVFTNSIGQKVELEFTKAEMIKMYVEFQDKSLTESFKEGNNFTEKIKTAIEKQLSPQDKAFAEKALGAWREQYQSINPVFSKMNGIDLPKNENYSPIRRVGFEMKTEKGLGEFIEEATYRKAISPKAIKARVVNILPIEKQNIFEALDRHFTETNYYIAWAEKIRELDSVFKDNNVRFVIKENYTSKTISAIDNTINDLATNGNKMARRYKVIDWLRKSFTVGALMIKPAIAVKQYVSTIAYYEVLSPKEFTEGVIDFWKNPIRNAKILNEESIMIKERGSNIERDIKAAIQSDVFHRYGKRQNFINTLMMNVKLGDKGAVLTGSWAIRKARLKKGVELKSVIREYEEFSSNTQQSSDLSQLSEVQRGGSFEQLFTMFKSSPRQYFAKELNAVKSLFQKGGASPKNIQKVAKTMVIYHFILPIFFQFVSNFGGWDEDDKKEYLRAGILGSMNGIFLFGDIVDSIIRTVLGLRVWDLEIPVATIADNVNKAIRKIDIEDITIEDVGEALFQLSEAGNSLGIPVEQTINTGQGIKTLMDGDVKNGLGLILGWSEFSLGIKKTKERKSPITREDILRKYKPSSKDIRNQILKKYQLK